MGCEHSRAIPIRRGDASDGAASPTPSKRYLKRTVTFVEPDDDTSAVVPRIHEQGSPTTSPSPASVTPPVDGASQSQRRDSDNRQVQSQPQSSPSPRRNGPSTVEDMEKMAGVTFREPKPTIVGDIYKCFAEGLCYRIHDSRSTAFAFYNNTYDYEMHVMYAFAPDSVVNPLSNTLVSASRDGWTKASTLVYPGQTQQFVQSNRMEGFACDVVAKPLGPEYRAFVATTTETKVRRELQAIRDHSSSQGANNNTPLSSEDTLAVCRTSQIPFVDVAFPPLAESVARPHEEGHSPILSPAGWIRGEEFCAPNTPPPPPHQKPPPLYIYISLTTSPAL